MKLLVLTNNPSRPSFRQRIEIHLKALQSSGIDCEVRKFPSGELSRLRLFKRAAAFDGVLLHKKCLNLFDAICLRRYSKRIIYDFDDAIMYSPERPGSNRSSHFRLFRRTAQLADKIIAGNDYLAKHARRFNHNVKILPTGLDTKAFSLVKNLKTDDKVRLVWIGSESTLKYLEEIKPALEQLGKRFSNVILRIICDEFFDLQNMQVEKCQWSLDGQYFDLLTSDIGLAPLPDNRFARGKCGFKILQYEAAGLPVVTSPVGVNSDYVVNDVTGYFASNIPQWIDGVSELIRNETLRKQMSLAAKERVARFDSEVIAKELVTLITEFMEGVLYSTEGATGRSVEQIITTTTDRPKVSICIPTYNRKKYLRETIDSVLAQTYKDYEIVIVDDGSTDGTDDMIKKLGVPVAYHWQENRGDATARNKLIELAKGQYISFIDSDDLLVPDAIERMVEVLEAENENVIVYGSYFRIDENGRIYSKCRRKLRSGNITKYLFQTILVHSCGSMFPKEILKPPLVFDTSLKVCSDYDLWLKLSAEYRFIALPKPTFKRRRHPDNLSRPSFESCLIEYKVLERFYYEKGGKTFVPEKIAMKVFSKEGRRAGQCALREGLYDQAYQISRQSFRQYPNIKSLVQWTKATVVKRLVSSCSAGN
ncbi:MAG: glycosyltransferase [Phycisphaerales bacterium]|jgi:glycosyltransferase involved in cell wall biosynthesis